MSPISKTVFIYWGIWCKTISAKLDPNVITFCKSFSRSNLRHVILLGPLSQMFSFLHICLKTLCQWEKIFWKIMCVKLKHSCLLHSKSIFVTLDMQWVFNFLGIRLTVLLLEILREFNETFSCDNHKVFWIMCFKDICGWVWINILERRKILSTPESKFSWNSIDTWLASWLTLA